MTAADHRRILEQLADSLWAERHVTEYLLFKLVTAKLLLCADERRFVAPALDEVERVLGPLREAGDRRVEAVALAARVLDVPAGQLALSQLPERAPAPLDEVFRDHQRAFARLAEEIEDTAAESRQLAMAGLRHVRETLRALTASGPEPASDPYNAAGCREAAIARAGAPRRGAVRTRGRAAVGDAAEERRQG